MKSEKVRQFFHHFEKQAKKSVCLFLTVGTTISMTACNLSFNRTADVVKSTVTGETTVHLEDDIVTEVANAINSTDFSNDSEVSDLANVINGAADIVENENDLQFESATLVRVVDGDTIIVNINNENYSVRLIGVNTPESVAPDSYRTENTAEGILASNYTKNLLSNVTTVYLEKDVSDTDKYGRLLRYVWLEIPEDPTNINEIATKMLNGILVLDNVAEVVSYEPDIKHASDFEYISEM